MQDLEFVVSIRLPRRAPNGISILCRGKYPVEVHWREFGKQVPSEQGVLVPLDWPVKLDYYLADITGARPAAL